LSYCWKSLSEEQSIIIKKAGRRRICGLCNGIGPNPFILRHNRIGYENILNYFGCMQALDFINKQTEKGNKMYTGTEPETKAVQDTIKDIVPNFEAIGWETKIAEISPDQIFDLVTALLVSYRQRLHERIREDVEQTSSANYGTEDFKGTLKEEPPKNKKYTDKELWDDPIPF